MEAQVASSHPTYCSIHQLSFLSLMLLPLMQLVVAFAHVLFPYLSLCSLSVDIQNNFLCDIFQLLEKFDDLVKSITVYIVNNIPR
jgi:hypothetical protein